MLKEHNESLLLGLGSYNGVSVVGGPSLAREGSLALSTQWYDGLTYAKATAARNTSCCECQNVSRRVFLSAVPVTIRINSGEKYQAETLTLFGGALCKNLDYHQAMLNGWLQGLDGSQMGTIRNIQCS